MMTRSATTTGSPLSKNIRTIGTSTAEIGKASCVHVKDCEIINRSFQL